jgi:hypothetical protein
VQELKNPLRVQKKDKLRRVSIFIRTVKLRVESSGEERRQRVEAFWIFWNSSKCRKKVCKSGGSTTAVRSAGEKRSGPLVSTSRKEQEEHTEEEMVSCRISLRYPSAVGSA